MSPVPEGCCSSQAQCSPAPRGLRLLPTASRKPPFHRRLHPETLRGQMANPRAWGSQDSRRLWWRGLRVAPVPCAVLALPRGTSPAGPASSHREVSGDSPRERAPGEQSRMFARPPWPRPASPGERGQAGWRPGGGRLASWALETGWAGFALFGHGHLFQA